MPAMLNVFDGAPKVMVFYPLSDMLPIAFGHYGVAEERVVEAFPQSVGNELWCLEVHVCHPQGQQVGIAISFLEHSVLQVVSPRPVNYLVEIVCHIYILF